MLANIASRKQQGRQQSYGKSSHVLISIATTPTKSKPVIFPSLIPLFFPCDASCLLSSPPLHLADDIDGHQGAQKSKKATLGLGGKPHLAHGCLSADSQHTEKTIH